jgi:hypothetical protein
MGQRKKKSHPRQSVQRTWAFSHFQDSQGWVPSIGWQMETEGRKGKGELQVSKISSRFQLFSKTLNKKDPTSELKKMQNLKITLKSSKQKF